MYRATSSRTPRPTILSLVLSMLFLAAPLLVTSVASYPLYILPESKTCARLSHCVTHWSGMTIQSSEPP